MYMTAFVCLPELMWRVWARAAFHLFIKPQFCFSTPRPESLRVERMERKDRNRADDNAARWWEGDLRRKGQTSRLMESGKKCAEQIKRSYCTHAGPVVPQLCV